MAGKYQPYPAYSSTGLEWLGDIPDGWTGVRLKNVTYINMGQSPNSDECNLDGNGRPFLQGNAEFGDKHPTPKNYCGTAKKVASEGQLLFSVRAPVGALNIADQEYGIGRGLCSIWPNSQMFLGFLWWVLLLAKSQLNSVSTGSTFEAVSAEQVGNCYLVMPPLPEQTQIAAFLDHETAKIDALIAKQERLIALLEEKRQAVISHAVTKGLNPDAPLSPSGIDWLGDVPAHWEVVKLSHRYEVLLGKMLDKAKVTGNFLGRYLRNTDVQWNAINSVDLPQMDFRPDEIERYSVIKGDLLVCEGGEVGRCAIWEEERPCFYQKALHRLRPIDDQRDTASFFLYSLTSSAKGDRFVSGINSATIAHLPAEAFREYRFAFPPLAEQIKISSFLKDQMRSFDLLSQKALSAIALLKERRTALISAAVTGKIDVRDWQPPKDLPDQDTKQKAFA